MERATPLIDSLDKLVSTLKKLREENNLTMGALAEAAGCAVATISYLEKGKRLPSMKVAYKIDKVFKTSPLFVDAVLLIEEKAKEIKRNITEGVMPGTKSPIMGTQIPIPILSAVPGLNNRWRDTDVKSEIWLSENTTKGRKLFCLEAKHDDMNRGGINKGDIVLIDPEGHPRNGDIVLYLCGEADDYIFLRYLRSPGSPVILFTETNIPSAPPSVPVVLSKKDESKIRGVVEGICYRPLRNTF